MTFGGLPQAAGPAGVRGRVAACRAGFRRRHGVIRDGLWNAIPGWRTAALCHRNDGDRGGRVCGGGGLVELPHAAPHDLPRPVGRSLQQRVSAHTVAHRHRQGPVVRGGTRGERPEVVLPARSAYRFLVRRPSRGTWFGGRRCDARPFPRVDLAQFLHRPPRFRRGP